jgi:A118 family predicted phage portal protein
VSVISAVLSANRTYNIEQAFNAKDITTATMRNAVTDWYSLYYCDANNDTEDTSQRLPVSVVSKLYKAIFSEYIATADGAKSGFVDEIIRGLDGVRKRAVQKMLVGGRCYIKPLLGQPMAFGVIDRRSYIPLGRDGSGNITDIGTWEQTQTGNLTYTLLERRTVDNAGYLTIENKLYRSDVPDSLGTGVPLNTLDKYASLEPTMTLPEPVFSIGLIPLECPAENCVDGSLDPVSVYAAACGLIHNINRNEAQINTEFENGRSRIFVSDDLLRKDKNGNRQFDRTLFVGIDDDPDKAGVTIFSPELREQSYLARKTEYLRNIESLIGMKRGVLSEVESTEKTATEITSSAGEYNLTIIDFQQSWTAAVREAVRVCNILGQMYHLCDSTGVDPEKDVTISWGNGILYDEDQAWTDYKAMVSAGMLKPEIALGWYFDMPTDTPADIAAIREKYMPEMPEDDNAEDNF